MYSFIDGCIKLCTCFMPSLFLSFSHRQVFQEVISWLSLRFIWFFSWAHSSLLFSPCFLLKHEIGIWSLNSVILCREKENRFFLNAQDHSNLTTGIVYKEDSCLYFHENNILLLCYLPNKRKLTDSQVQTEEYLSRKLLGEKLLDFPLE